MPNENSGDHAREGRPLPKQKQAEHESGHGIVIDEYGWELEWINIKDGEGKPRMVKAKWGDFETEVAQTNWSDPVQRESMKPKILNYVTCLVAGHLAENAIDPTEQKVSERLTPEILAAGKKGRADRDRVAYFLKLIQCNTMAEVLAAEDRAAKILTKRQAHLKALSEALFEQQYIEGAALKKALGKEDT